ncbi:hypothetical protein T484DRAFT_1844401, partial [Baffinella frigidus]
NAKLAEKVAEERTRNDEDAEGAREELDAVLNDLEAARKEDPSWGYFVAEKVAQMAELEARLQTLGLRSDFVAEKVSEKAAQMAELEARLQTLASAPAPASEAKTPSPTPSQTLESASAPDNEATSGPDGYVLG